MPVHDGQASAAPAQEFWFMQFWQEFARSSKLWLLFAELVHRLEQELVS